jgi:hypothetical protein
MLLPSRLSGYGLSLKHQYGHPKFARLMKKEEKQLRKLQVGKGAQKRVTEQEMAEREAMVNVNPGARPRRVTPLKIAF